MRLGGFMFFGNVREVEEGVNRVLNSESDAVASYGATHPNTKPKPGIRFLVLDLTHVVGVDMSALEGLMRMRRLLERRNVCMVMCGVTRGKGPVGMALETFFGGNDEGHVASSGGHAEDRGAKVEIFDTFGDAMECEIFA